MQKPIIEQYAAGATKLGEAIQGLVRADFLAVPAPGTWSIQQIVLHTTDSDLIASDRMKRIIAEKNPLLLAYDESAFAQNVGYEHLDPFMAAKIFELNRGLTAEILRHVPEEAWSRTGIHNQRGKVTLRELVESYVGHLEHHLKFVREKRKMLGKPVRG